VILTHLLPYLFELPLELESKRKSSVLQDCILVGFFVIVPLVPVAARPFLTKKKTKKPILDAALIKASSLYVHKPYATWQQNSHFWTSISSNPTDCSEGPEHKAENQFVG